MSEPTMPTREELEKLVEETMMIANLPEECCARCKFGQHDGPGPLYCFRFPPQAVMFKPAKFREQLNGQFPPTRPDLWCGEFRPRKPSGRWWVRRLWERMTNVCGETSLEPAPTGIPPKETLQ